MKLRAPKQITFFIAVILAIIGVLAELVPIPTLAGFAIWLVAIAFVLLALGVMLKDL